VDFFELRRAVAGEKGTLAYAGGESIACGIGKIRDGKDLEVETAVVQFLNVGRGEVGAGGG
jgi:hypothetical protein